MNNNKTKRKLLFTFIILFFILLFCLLMILLKLTEGKNDTGNDNVVIQELPKTLEDAVDKTESIYIKEDGENNIIYMILAKDLYNEDGSSNEKFVKDTIKELEPFYDGEDFKIIDENHDITIEAKYDEETDTYDIIINDVKDFYEETDGKSYASVDDSKIVKGSSFYVTDYSLNKLESFDGYFSYIKDNFGEGTETEDGYISYQDGNVKIKTSEIDSVKNIIYDRSYETTYTKDIDNTTSLKKILEYEPNPDFGSLEEGYLGYRQYSFYLFFYDDEVSIHSYGYRKNNKFEWMLEEYLEDRDLDKFVKRIKEKWKVYDKLEYDPDSQNLYVLFSNRGVEIDIKGNNPKGIKLYSNYYFTDETRKFVKNGQISFVPNTDLLDKTERERRNGN